MQLAGANVLLTGATGGLGHAIARLLASRGAHLVLTGRRADVLEPLAREINGRALAADLSQAPEVDRLLDEAGDIDVLVANAGLPASGRLDSFSAQEIDRALAVNLRAPIVMARILADRMAPRRRGQLVFVSSLAGKTASAESSIYSATKFGLRGFAQALRAELHGSGIGVSAIYPGFIRDSGMFAESGAKLPAGVGTRTPADVAAAVLDAIERDRAEVDVAPIPVRAGALLGGVAPGLAAAVSRRLGADQLTRDIGAGQKSKR